MTTAGPDAPGPRIPDPLRGHDGGTRRIDPRTAVFAFDQVVDRIAEEAGFLALGANRQAARYLADAHAALAQARDTMHRIEAGASDPMLRRSAQRRMHALAVSIAEAGLRDADHVAATAYRLNTPALQQSAGWGTTLRTHTAKVTAWSVQKWTGSPLASAELRSSAAVTQAVRAVEPIVRRGQVRRTTPATRAWRRAGIATAAVGGSGLALYGAWSLIAPLLGLG
ncbi:hypothetical protein [Microbacterium marinilacus]|uniref:Uncharacterized protein n=1 Tax=Microbacterium marinilacus TaxID=415209 RepID=A0ABP7BD65_9MICO|nr:hypothetical protein [Microbacterium marinilacus]MBY0689287.1 hypothetical protein [Microbacterium marinilacus]